MMKLGMLVAIVALGAATGCAAESSGPESDVSEPAVVADEAKHAPPALPSDETQEPTHKNDSIPVLGESPVPHRPDPAGISERRIEQIEQPVVLPAQNIVVGR